MDLKACVQFEIKKNDRVYLFYGPLGSPHGEVYDVFNEMRAELIKMMQQAAEREKQQKEVSEQGLADKPA